MLFRSIGSNIRTILGEKGSDFTVIRLEDEIRSSIDNYEPRVDIIGVDVDFLSDGKAYRANIVYKVIRTQILETLIIDLEIIS